jgi:hypothetical protein
METENLTGRRPSGLFRSLSWIVREEGDSTRQQTTRRFSLRRKRPGQSDSMFSSLSDRLQTGSVSIKADTISIPQPDIEPSPGVSFQPTSLPYLGRATDALGVNTVSVHPNRSAVSVDTVEIQGWKTRVGGHFLLQTSTNEITIVQ